MKSNPTEFNKHLTRLCGELSSSSKQKRATVDSSTVENEFGFIQINTSEEFKLQLEMPREAIMFTFVIEGEAIYQSPVARKKLAQSSNEVIMMTLPFQDWMWRFELASGSSVLLLVISVAKLHEFFNKELITEGSGMDAVLKSYRKQEFFTVRKMTPAISVIVRQVFSNQLDNSFQKLFHKAKVLEFISLYLNGTEYNTAADTNCPYINDDLDLEKIRRAREIITERVISPPKLSELAKVVGTNEFKLKVGFKHLYGTTVFGYLNDYRMNLAREILERDNYQIKEVAYQIGYANTSHFISAFKRKYGVTPKKYLQGLA